MWPDQPDPIPGQLPGLERRPRGRPGRVASGAGILGLSLDLGPGVYRTTCQIGPAAHPGELAVGGGTGGSRSSQATDLQHAADQYRTFLAARVDALVTDLTSLAAAVGRRGT